MFLFIFKLDVKKGLQVLGYFKDLQVTCTTFLIVLSVYSLGNNPSEKFINASTFPNSIS